MYLITFSLVNFLVAHDPWLQNPVEPIWYLLTTYKIRRQLKKYIIDIDLFTMKWAYYLITFF